MDKYHITRYQEIRHFKQARKGVINDDFEKIEVSISSLQNKSSAVIKSTTHCNCKTITSPNNTNISEMSAFSSASYITTESNSISVSNGPLNFGIDSNFQNQLLPMRPVLLLPYLILLFQKDFNLAPNPQLKKAL